MARWLETENRLLSLGQHRALKEAEFECVQAEHVLSLFHPSPHHSLLSDIQLLHVLATPAALERTGVCNPEYHRLPGGLSNAPGAMGNIRH